MKRVMIVDDEPDFLAVARAWLGRRYELIALSDGCGLGEQIDAWEPDALILDLRLPGDDGLELCRRLRAQGRRSLPVLFLTASHRDEDFFRSFDAGGSGYLTKPVSRRELIARLEELLPSL